MRLIDADALIEYMGARVFDLREMYGDYDHYTDGFEAALCLAEDAPTIDAVPVVRCAECKWFDKGGNGVAPICARHSGLAGAHDRSFCSYGERKIDG